MSQISVNSTVSDSLVPCPLSFITSALLVQLIPVLCGEKRIEIDRLVGRDTGLSL